jgi:signal transduction histidine kinase
LSLHLQLLKHKLSNPDPAVSQHVTKIQDQVNKLTNLVKDLLTISRIESGKINYNFETFNLVELVQNILSSFPKDSHRLKFTFNPVPMYYGDPERITQAIFNLISNALKYSPDNSTVNVNLVKDGEHDIAISIKDRGPGIQKENHEKIFERFFQIKDTQINRTYPGLGIGLFTARQIARSHGGDISLVSDTGQGSVFTLNLPLIQS